MLEKDDYVVVSDGRLFGGDDVKMLNEHLGSIARLLEINLNGKDAQLLRLDGEYFSCWRKRLRKATIDEANYLFIFGLSKTQNEIIKT